MPEAIADRDAAEIEAMYATPPTGGREPVATSNPQPGESR